jgi:hypothetical protein
MPCNTGVINGSFTWYISSTTKKMSCKKYVSHQFRTTGDLLLYNDYNMSYIMNNNILFSLFNIRNSVEFIEQSNYISSPNIYLYIFKNPNNQYMLYLNLLHDENSIEIMEMLNSDAIETAAEKAGIVTDSVADIFHHILGGHFEKFVESRDAIEFINNNMKNANRLPFSSNPDQDDTYTRVDIINKREILYNYSNIKHVLESSYIVFKSTYDDTSIAIKRVKDNIIKGECPICTTELSDEDEEILIIKCCGVIVCGTCCFGTIFKNKLNGICCNCRTEIDINKLIYLNKSFDLSNIVDDKLEIKTRDVCVKNEDSSHKKPREKIDTIIDIIKDIHVTDRIPIDISISNMMKGTCEFKEVDQGYNKVLIFANYDESIKNIKNALSANNIQFWILQGNHSEISRVVKLFTESVVGCVLIINSINHCSGLNLQSSTDLIFVHKILDNNIESQVIGRGQRLGRTSTLRVHYLCYENEYAYMQNTTDIRIL